MATLIVLRDRKSHSFRIGGKDRNFRQNKGLYTSDPKVIAYVESMPQGMFSITRNTEPPRPKSAAAQAEPLDKGAEVEPEAKEEKVEKKPARRAKRRKVTTDE